MAATAARSSATRAGGAAMSTEPLTPSHTQLKAPAVANTPSDADPPLNTSPEMKMDASCGAPEGWDRLPEDMAALKEHRVPAEPPAPQRERRSSTCAMIAFDSAVPSFGVVDEEDESGDGSRNVGATLCGGRVGMLDGRGTTSTASVALPAVALPRPMAASLAPVPQSHCCQAPPLSRTGPTGGRGSWGTGRVQTRVPMPLRPQRASEARSSTSVSSYEA